MRLATAFLLLPRAATACPIGWLPSPTSGTCFKVPPERSTSLFRCVDLCKDHGGVPACIGSAEENRHVTAELAATEFLWLGLYQKETRLGLSEGWRRCVGGDAPTYYYRLYVRAERDNTVSKQASACEREKALYRALAAWKSRVILSRISHTEHD